MATVGSALVVCAVSAAEPSDSTPISEQQKQWRSQIKSTLFIPDPLPALEASTHGQFEPEPGIVAQRVTYASQFGLRVSAILYLPKERKEKIPALIVVNGHGGDKYSWYAFYTGILYARAGAAVLTFDPIGEGERNIQRRSGTRAHDQKLEPREMALRMGGTLVSDVMQAVSYLQSRSEVDGRRIGAMGYSLGSFLTAIAGAADPRLQSCVLVGGGNLDGEGGYWDGSKPMCQGIPYQSLQFLGDRPAALYALHAARGPTLIFNGTADSVVGIPRHGHNAAFFKDLQDRVIRLKGTSERVFDFQFVPDVSHRPFFVTRPVALWLEQHLDFPNWTPAAIAALPETHIAKWAASCGVAIDPNYASEDREGGTRALGENVPGLSRDALSVFSQEQWERERDRFVYESWVEAARFRVAATPATETLNNTDPKKKDGSP
jgi:dienelactone hydrolase